MANNEVTFKLGEILPDDYPVFLDYLYFADDKLIRSDIRGDISDLKRDLRQQNILFSHIHAARIEGGE